MSDHQGSTASERSPKGALHQRLVLAVEVARRLVEHHDGRALQQHPRYRETLLLSARQPIAALAYDGVPAVGQALDQFVNVSGTTRLVQFIVGGSRAGIAKVGGNGVVKQVRVLGDHADVRPQ